MRLTDEYIRKRYQDWLREIDTKNRDELGHVSEKLRALWVLQVTHGNMRPAAAMSLYMVRQEVAKEILAEFGEDSSAAQNSVPRKAKYSAIEKWCKENVMAQISAKGLADIGEISYPTALKYISDHPDVFWKIGRGIYEVRDPIEDRKREKK